ncbi:MAG: hypothetical protein HOP36_06315 [Methyloglobulus sp.]|nr:hypothetical protein [Methyloglobulus sp.]
MNYGFNLKMHLDTRSSLASLMRNGKSVLESQPMVRNDLLGHLARNQFLFINTTVSKFGESPRKIKSMSELLGYESEYVGCEEQGA